MSLERVTPERARTLEAGDTVVSPYSGLPFMPLRITEVQHSPTGRVMLRTHSLSASSQMAGGWTLATNYWLPPVGFKWNKAMHQWEQRDRDGALRATWPRPTLAELGLARDSDGWVTTTSAEETKS